LVISMGNEPKTALRARVFVSCGQNRASAEPRIARDIADRLERMGFDPYIAIERQSLRSLRENVFAQLRDTEYFLFVDFPREEISGDAHRIDKYRGSLFSHQELAIASYLDIDLIAFRHNSVRNLDGILGHLQGNCIEFLEDTDLPALVEDQVSKRWQSSWRNSLGLELIRLPERAVVADQGGVPGVFHLIRVTNHHRAVAARDCTAHLRSIVDLRSGVPIEFATAELKWAGVPQPTVTIMPRGYRELDAIWYVAGSASSPRFSILTDSTRHVPRIGGSGSWRLTYEVVCSNVAGAELDLVLTLDGSPHGFQLSPV